MLVEGPPTAPGRVREAIERDLDRGKLMVYPDLTSKLALWMRRLLPGVMWRGAHRIEGF